MSYEIAADIARTWGMVYFIALFAGVLVYALRPRARKTFEDAASIPFKEE